MECHKCKFNGLSSEHCLSCTILNTPRGKYQTATDEFIESYSQPESEQPDRPTTLPEDMEDRLRMAIIDLASLSYNEICLLLAILNRKSLTEFAKEMQQMASENLNFSRHKAFQERKRILTQCPWMKIALQTFGQRKELKPKN